MITKSRLKEAIEKLPEVISIEELIERLILLEKIERGDEQSKNGQVLSEEELDKEIQKWFE